MASWGVEAAARRVAELEEELRGLAEELSSCQADKEFVWSLWKHLQVSSPDLMQAVGLVVEREKQKAEVKDRRVLELLEAKDSKIETLEQKQKEKVEGEEKLKSVRLTGQHEEINNLMQRKNAVEEENACLKNEFSTLNQKFKDKSQELKDTEECAQKKEEQNRLVIKNLEEENKGLNTCCADLLSDLEKLRKQQAQWKMEKSGSDAIIKNLKTDLAEAREQIKELRSICGNLSSLVAVKQEQLFRKNCDVIKAKKELQELQNLCGQNTEYTAQQAELIKQVQALNANTQKVMKDQEDAHTAEITLYQKLYNELSLCFETVKTSEIQLQQSCASLQDHLLEKDKTICLLQVQLQEAYNASNAVHQNSSPKYQMQEPPVKRSRSLSPKSSFRESEELRKLKIAERKTENLEKTLQLKTRETDELRAAYEKHKERLQMLQTNYRALKEQLKQWEEGDTRLNLEEELHQMKIHQSVEPLFKLREDDGVKNNTVVRNMREVSPQMLQKMQQLERRLNAIEGELRKQKEVNKCLLNQKIYLKESLKVQKEDADTRERELEMLLKRTCEIKKEKSELQLVTDEKEKEAASLKRQVAEANRLRNESEDLLSQVQEPKCLPDKAKAVTTSGQCNCKITGTKVKLKTAKEKSSLGHHGAFLKQSIKVMSNVFEKFSKDGWEDVNESSDSEIPNSESLETVIMKTVQNIDPLPDRSKQQEKKSCNTVHLEGKNEQYNQKCHSQNKDLEKLHSKRRKICYLVTSHPSILSKVNRAKRRNITIQKPGYSVTLLQERIKSLQKQIAVLKNEKNTAVASVKEVKETNEKLTNQLHLANQRLQTSKLTIEMLTSNLAKWQQEKEDLQGKLKLREHLSQTAGKSKATPAPSKNIDLEMKQLQCKLKNSNNEITKQSTTIKSLKNEVQEKEERIRELQAKISRLERDFTVKRHLIEDLKSHLKASQENEKTSNETLESLERKVKALAEDCSGKKTSIDSLKQRLNVATKEKSQYEQMYHKAKDELEKKDLKLTKLESKIIETESAMTELETATSDQLHSLAKQSAEALETVQKKLLLTSDKVEEFKTFVKTLSRELQHSIQELRTKIKKAKKVGKMKACKNCLSQESVQLAASILNVSTTDLEEILDVEDEEETAKTKMEFEKDKEWLQRIQKLTEAQVSTHCLSSDHTHILTRAQVAAHTHHCNSSPEGISKRSKLKVRINRYNIKEVKSIRNE
ncbi:PREDICTED: centlein isoform X8 [Lepidothrix coronata]|uniref:Centlein isoform X8 n=1 Tax=Lepidothrix coronata TaxID=321398 RepID=A0A6J0GI97_9PASS|nr:PREDICTED: centlein isoform X8 [Lepidothrix coronata]